MLSVSFTGIEEFHNLLVLTSYGADNPHLSFDDTHFAGPWFACVEIFSSDVSLLPYYDCLRRGCGIPQVSP